MFQKHKNLTNPKLFNASVYNIYNIIYYFFIHVQQTLYLFIFNTARWHLLFVISDLKRFVHVKPAMLPLLHNLGSHAIQTDSLLL